MSQGPVILQFGTGIFLRGFVADFVQRYNDRTAPGSLTGAKKTVWQIQPVKSTQAPLPAYLMGPEPEWWTLFTGGETQEAGGVPPLIRNLTWRPVWEASKDWQAIEAVATSENCRIIVTNTTEAGLLAKEPESASGHSTPPVTLAGKLAWLLHGRYRSQARDTTLVILPCELLADNGDLLKAAVRSLLDRFFGPDPARDQWLDERISFANTLVDRIVAGAPPQRLIDRMSATHPALTDRDAPLLAAEAFGLWAIQARKSWAYEILRPLAEANPDQIVLGQDLGWIAERKVRLLNAPHTLMAGRGLVEGISTVGAVMTHPELGSWVTRLLTEEIPGMMGDITRQHDTEAYGRVTARRFANPDLDHVLTGIARQSITKLGTRVGPLLPMARAHHEALAEGVGACFHWLTNQTDLSSLDDRAADLNTLMKDSTIDITQPHGVASLLDGLNVTPKGSTLDAAWLNKVATYCRRAAMAVLSLLILLMPWTVSAQRQSLNQVPARPTGNTQASTNERPATYDLVIYGATAGGVIAAVSAARLGRRVAMVEPTQHIGGMTTGGLGMTDIGNKYAISGLALDFYRRVGAHYGHFEGWRFAPSVASKVLDGYLREVGDRVTIIPGHALVRVDTSRGRIQRLHCQPMPARAGTQTRVISGKYYIDATYEGDLLALAGVPFRTGREANSEYRERYNGVQRRTQHQFPDGIDPYRIEGDTTSGLCWGIRDEPLKPEGSGDERFQAYNFRICLLKDSTRAIPLPRPDHYDPARYQLLARLIRDRPNRSILAYLKIDTMPGNKTDINNQGAFSTDMIGANYGPWGNWATASYTQREAIAKEHKDYILGLLYFLGHDPQVPEHLKAQMRSYGLPPDEYTKTGHWSPQLYVREARRMVGAYVMTEHNCVGDSTVDDGVGLAAYTMDSHNTTRELVPNPAKPGFRMVKNEGDVQVGGFGPYPVSYRAMLPPRGSIDNLLVPVCLSATHIAYGSIRMEPVFMVLGQSAALAVDQALRVERPGRGPAPLREVDVKALQKRLKEDPRFDGSMADILIDNSLQADRVTKTGAWTVSKPGGETGKFALDALSHRNETAGDQVRFAIDVPKEGAYDIYYYIGGFNKRAPKDSITRRMPVTVRGYRGGQDVEVDARRYYNDWAPLGRYTLRPGLDTQYVSITSDGSGLMYVADAVLLMPANRQGAAPVSPATRKRHR